MLEELRRILSEYCAPCIDQIDRIPERIAGYSPSQTTVLWFQLAVACLTIVWILFQFTWLRRLNEARLEKYLEDKLATDREDLAQERAEVLAQLEHVAERTGIARAICRVWAEFWLLISFAMRIFRLGKLSDPVGYSMLLLQVGKRDRARDVFADAALDAIRAAKLYETALEKRRLAAQNALVFAGRVAMLDGRQAVAVSAFNRAIKLRDDPEAHLLIGRQLAAGQDLDGALREFRAAMQPRPVSSVAVEVTPMTKAEAHRWIARLHIKQGSPGRARSELTKARTLEAPLKHYSGIAQTDEMIGDLYAPRPRYRGAARSAYRDAITNFRLANDRRGMARVTQKLRRLDGRIDKAPDGWWLRTLHRFAQALLRLVEQQRARAQRKAA